MIRSCPNLGHEPSNEVLVSGRVEQILSNEKLTKKIALSPNSNTDANHPLHAKMVLKQRGKPEKGKKPVRGAPRQFSDPREFPDEPHSDESENSSSESSGSETETETETESDNSVEQIRTTLKNTVLKPEEAKPKTPATKPTTTPSAPKEMSRREREAVQKEQARQHYMKMKEKEDGARLAIIRKQREEAAAKHAEEQRAKEAARRRP
jgi:hypothetical protein